MEKISIYTDEDRLFYLAYLYDRLARHLLHEPLIAPQTWMDGKATTHFDMEDDHLQAYVEVKGASNTDQLKLFESQLDSQLEELGFPYDDAFILIFNYRNCEHHMNGPFAERRRLLKRMSGKSLETLWAFLAKNTTKAYLIDIHLLDLLRKKYGTRAYARDSSNVRNAIRINRRTLDLLSKDTRTALVDLGLPKEDIPHWLPPRAHRTLPRTVETVLDDCAINFQLIPLLPNGDKVRFLKRLNGTVKHC